jgi:putative peptidoglycan lipid II flippase
VPSLRRATESAAPRPRRLLPAAREILGPAVNFGGRIAGIAVTLLIVRYTGVGPSAVPVLLAIALFGFAQSALNGPLEIQVVAEVGGRSSPAPAAPLLVTSLLLGAASGAVMIVASVVLSRLAGGLEKVAWYFVPLGLSLPLAACFSAVQGIEIARGNWTAPGLASLARTAVIVALVALLIGELGLIIVPLAFLVGEMVRLGLTVNRLGALRGFSLRIDRGFGSRVAQQIPSSMLSSIAPTVDRFLIAVLSLGSVAVLDLADKAAGFLNLSVAQGLIPTLYRRWAQIEEPARRRARILGATRAILFSSVGVALAAAAVLPPVVAAVARISDPGARSSLDWTLWFLLAGFPGYVASQTVVRLMILERLHRWFNLTAVVQVVANVLLDVLLGLRWGVPGVAAATALVWWLGLALCYAVVRRNPVRDEAASPGARVRGR